MFLLYYLTGPRNLNTRGKGWHPRHVRGCNFLSLGRTETLEEFEEIFPSFCNFGKSCVEKEGCGGRGRHR